jgi:hypothetical protein
LKIKQKGCHFIITEVIDAESQPVLDTLTEHDFQDAFKKNGRMLETVHMSRRGLPQG